jgi:phenylalanyl-tRNA synthetase beta chain
MAVVEFNKKDLEKLLGKKLTKKDIEETIPMFGCPLEKLEKDRVYYELSPNRPDMLSIEGFARSIRKFMGLQTGLERYKTRKSRIKLYVDESVKNVRPYIVAAVVRDVKLTDDVVASLMQVQEKLHDTLGRKRKKVAIGVHDLDKVVPPFYYKASKPESIEFIPLGMTEKMNMRKVCEKHPKGIEYRHIVEKNKKWPVIVDKNGDVLSFPPVINGELTKVTQKTKNLFIDITGTSFSAVNLSLNIIVTSFYDRGCKIETVEILNGKRITTPVLEPWKMKIDIGYVNELLDLRLSKRELSSLLKKMGLGFDGKNVLIPPYRTDIMHQMDIVEDVAIAYGYQNFEPRIPKIATIGKTYPMNEFLTFLRDTMTGLGHQEVVTMTLSNRDNEFKKMNREEEKVCETMNPITVECTICRRRVLPSLLKVLSQNLHREYPHKIFEIGDINLLNPRKETGAERRKSLACVISDVEVSYEKISSVLDALLKSIGIDFKLQKTNNNSFINGRCANIVVNKKIVGIIGEVHPQVLNNWKLEKPVVGFEIDVNNIYDLVRK